MKRCIVCAHFPEGSGPEGAPIGSPVKDSLATKIYEGAQHFLSIIYGTTETHSLNQMTEAVNRFAALLAEETGGWVERSVAL